MDCILERLAAERDELVKSYSRGREDAHSAIESGLTFYHVLQYGRDLDEPLDPAFYLSTPAGFFGKTYERGFREYCADVLEKLRDYKREAKP